MRWIGLAALVFATTGGVAGAASKLDLDVAPLLSVPYGYAYYEDAKGALQSLRAYPTLARDMHAFGNPPPTQEADPQWIREAWRVSLANGTDKTVVVEALDLVRTSYSPLPLRWVCVWKQQGINSPKNVSVKLSGARERWSLLDAGETVKLDPDDAQPFLVKVAAAEPGIYRLRVVAKYRVVGGRVDEIQSDEVALFVPDRGGPSGVFILNPLHQDVLIRRILKLGADKWEFLSRESKKGSWNLERAPQSEVEEAVREKDDAIFLRTLRQWRDLTLGTKSLGDDDDLSVSAVRIGPPSRSMALALAHDGRFIEAIRVMEQYLGTTPEDSEGAVLLMSFYLHLKRYDDATRYWKQLQSGPVARTADFYRLGALFASETKNNPLLDQLVRESKRLYPEDVQLLQWRLARLDETGRYDAIPTEFARACRYAAARSPADSDTFRLLGAGVLERAYLVASSQLGRSIEELVRVCPRDVGWTVRTDSTLWFMAPSLRISADGSEADRLPPDELATVVRSLAESGRPALALKFAERGLRRGARADLFELVGDAHVGDKAWDAADGAYARALVEVQPNAELFERVLIKRLVTLYRRGNVFAFRDFLDGIDPDRKTTLPSPLPPGWRPRAIAVLRLFRGFAMLDRNMVNTSLAAWLQADLFEPLGGYTADALAVFLTMVKDVAAARDRMSIGRSVPIPESLLSMLERSYRRLPERALTIPFPGVEEDWRLGKPGAWTGAVMLKRIAKSADDEPIIVRLRDSIRAGARVNGSYHVLDDGKVIPLDEWAKRHESECVGAKPGVYLQPIRGAHFEAELKHGEAVGRGFFRYDIDGAIGDVKTVVATDPLNVHAWRSLALLTGAAGDRVACAAAATHGLELDPKEPVLIAAKTVCTAP